MYKILNNYIYLNIILCQALNQYLFRVGVFLALVFIVVLLYPVLQGLFYLIFL